MRHVKERERERYVDERKKEKELGEKEGSARVSKRDGQRVRVTEKGREEGRKGEQSVEREREG